MSGTSASVGYGAADIVRLPLRVHPEPDETILSMVVRLASENLFDHVFGLTALAGLSSACFDRLARQPVDLKGFAVASGITETRLRYMQYLAPDEEHVSWLGKPVHRHLVHTRHRKWCPICIREKAYHRASWDLLPIGVCVRHCAALVTRCPKCSEVVTWPGKTVVNCRCGADLRNAVAKPVSDRAVTAARRLLDSLQGTASGPAGLTGSEALWLATVLGWMAVKGQCHPPTELSMWRRPETTAGILEVGWDALDDWPHGFHTYLKRQYPDDRLMWPIVRWVARQYRGHLQAEMAEMMSKHGWSGSLAKRHPKSTRSDLHAAIA